VPPEHEPQFNVEEHPSLTTPQVAPSSEQLFGVQVPGPQTFGAPPPPQFSPFAQLPHETVPPQPSSIDPQAAEAEAQVRGVQVARETQTPIEQS
jgi:hypothetical protein